MRRFYTCRVQIPKFSWGENRTAPQGNSGADQEAMKRISLPFVIALLMFFGLAPLPLCCAGFAAEPQMVDGVAAVVNGAIITLSQVRGLSAPRAQLLRSQYTGAELEKQVQATR